MIFEKHTSPSTASLTALRASVRGRVILPGDAEYDTARLAWNRKVDQYPTLIVVAHDPADVVAAVEYARTNDLGVAVQSTGHGNIRPADETVFIVTTEMNRVRVDPAGQTAWIEAGARWGAVLELAQDHGLAPLLGSSPTVGAVGYTLGGGLGWLARKYGLAADSVLRFEVVTGDGRLRTASAAENSDLFWGLRGGGGTPGIVTAMEMRLYPVSTVYAGNLYYPAEMAGEVFRHYRTWIENVPRELTTSVLVMNFPPLPELPDFLRGRSFAMVRGCFCGPTAEGETLLGHWRRWRTPLLDDFKEISFRHAAVISNDPVDPMPAYNTGAWLSRLSDDGISAIVSHTLPQGGPPAFVFAEVRHVGGAMASVATKETAFGNRDARLVLSVVGVTPTPEIHEAVVAHAGRLKAALRPDLTGGVYMNFLEGIESQQRVRDGLAPAGFDRLARLKARYDPENRIRSGFNVPPAG